MSQTGSKLVPIYLLKSTSCVRHAGPSEALKEMAVDANRPQRCFCTLRGRQLRLQVCFRQRNISTWMTQVSCFKPNPSIWPTVYSVTDKQLRLQDSVEKQNSILLRLRRGKRACS